MYIVKAFTRANNPALVDEIETEYFYEVQDFVYEKCSSGFDCELKDGDHVVVFYFEDFCID